MDIRKLLKQSILLGIAIFGNCTLYAERKGFVGPWRGVHESDYGALIADNEASALQDVDISEDAMAIVKRAGYVQFKTVGVSTWAVRGLYFFRDTGGTDTVIAANNRSVFKSTGSVAFSAFITTDTAGASYDFVDTQGYLYRLNSERDELARYDGTTLTYFPSAPKGKQIEALPDRLAIAGTTANRNCIDFSGAGAFTTFTVGALETDPFQECIGLPGQDIAAIKYFQGDLLIWNRTSMYRWSGTNQYDAVIETISDRIGTVQPYSVVVNNPYVYWQGQDHHYYRFDGSFIENISKIYLKNSVKTFMLPSSTSFTTAMVDSKQRIMFSQAEANATTANVTYIYEPQYDTFLKYSDPWQFGVVVSTSMYFAGVSTGVVYSWPNGTTDDGTSFQAFWRSKNHFNNPFIENSYESFSFLGSVPVNSSFTVTYNLVYTTYSVATDVTFVSTVDTTRYNYMLPAGTVGQYFDLDLGDVAASTQTWNFWAFEFEFTPLPWRVLP